MSELQATAAPKPESPPPEPSKVDLATVPAQSPAPLPPVVKHDEPDTPPANADEFRSLADFQPADEGELIPVLAKPSEPAAPLTAEPTSPVVVSPAPAQATPPSPAPATPPTPPAPTQTPEQIEAAKVEFQKRMKEGRDRTMDQLRKAFEIKFTDAEKELLATEPHTVLEKKLPELAAQVGMMLFESLFFSTAQQLQQQMANLPVLLEQQTERLNAQKGVLQRFNAAWPTLNKPEYSETVARIAGNYAKLNPGTPEEQAINEIGMLAHYALKLPIPASQPQAPNPPAPPMPPVRPASSAPGAAAMDRRSEWEDLAEFQPE